MGVVDTLFVFVPIRPRCMSHTGKNIELIRNRKNQKRQITEDEEKKRFFFFIRSLWPIWMALIGSGQKKINK